MAIKISTPIVKRLQDQGLIPDHCSNLELIVPPNGAMTLRYEILITEKHLAILGATFTAMAEEITPE